MIDLGGFGWNQIIKELVQFSKFSSQFALHLP